MNIYDIGLETILPFENIIKVCDEIYNNEKLINKLSTMIVLEDYSITVPKLKDCIDRVIFSPPVTVVLWKDGTKTTVRCQDDDVYDKEKGLIACIIKRITGNNGEFNEILKEWIKDEV